MKNNFDNVGVWFHHGGDPNMKILVLLGPGPDYIGMKF